MRQRLGADAGGGQSEAGERKLIVGIRPEHFEDVELVDERQRVDGMEFDTEIDNIEWLGSELYAYLPYTGAEEIGALLGQLAGDLDREHTAADESQLVARLDATSRVTEGKSARIWLDGRKIHLFDPETGDAVARAALT